MTPKSQATDAKNKLMAHQTKYFCRENKVMSKLKDNIWSGKGIEIIWLMRN